MAANRLDGAGERACWFVGATYGDRNEDQSARFLAEGIWVNGYTDKYLDAVRSIQPGDRIAIKSAYTRKKNLPFDNKGHRVSTMAIKAIGVVVDNLGDGRTLKVDWAPVNPAREWYFYTSRATVWRVLPGNLNTDDLIRFAFAGDKQDLDRFRNAPHWRDRFGDQPRHFIWTDFYEAVADGLLKYRDRRDELLAGIYEIEARLEGFSISPDLYRDGSRGPLRDICPFTVMGMFNRGITEANRKSIAEELARFLGVTAPVPPGFEGIPLLSNMRSWFFAFERDRGADDIQALWDVFAAAIALADSDAPEEKEAFQRSYDVALSHHGVGWNLSIGCYWIRPWSFISLDERSRTYVKAKLGIAIAASGTGGRCNAEEYVGLLEAVKTRFLEDGYPVHSFPELSLAAFAYTGNLPGDVIDEEPEGAETADTSPPVAGPPIKPYSIDQILDEGCFMPRQRLEVILDRLEKKRNVILQGPPGTGKSWLAKRLAYAMVGQIDERKVRPVQFHPNLSYEDFVRGWRPSGDGRLTLVDGPFMEMINAANNDSDGRYVVVIEEINRGNPAQILGEMLTLMEADKRTPAEGLELSYRRSEGERVSIPTNLFVIGTMNVADRSLALVDLALRRRFAFIDLEPTFGERWRSWVKSTHGLSSDFLTEIERRIVQLNETIEAFPGLGPQFRIGHSFVTPPTDTKISEPSEWFQQVVETEIGPLLEEYWYDTRDKAREQVKLLAAAQLP